MRPVVLLLLLSACAKSGPATEAPAEPEPVEAPAEAAPAAAPEGEAPAEEPTDEAEATPADEAPDAGDPGDVDGEAAGEADGAPAAGERIVLQNLAGCTRRACPPDEPCCNRCTFGGWAEVESGDRAAAAEGELPTCEPDGCGHCDTHLVATGERRDGQLVLTSWEVVQGAP